MVLAKLTDYTEITKPYNETVQYGVVRLQMYNGIAKQKSTLLSPIKKVSLGLVIIGNDKKKQFDLWYKNDLQGGVSRFLYRVPIENKTYIARFAKHPLTWDFSGQGEIWTTSVTIEYRL